MPIPRLCAWCRTAFLPKKATQRSCCRAHGALVRDQNIVTRARRTRWIPIRPCAWCQEPFKPQKRTQRCCCVSHAACLRDQEHPELRLQRLKAGQQAGQRRRRQSLARTLGGPITPRDEAAYQLGWRQCLNTHRPRRRPHRRTRPATADAA